MRRPYLQQTDIINWHHPAIGELSVTLRNRSSSLVEYIRSAFHFVRDQVKHSWDYHCTSVTCRASDVLNHRTGYCYAKSHLLAALLRAQEIPAGFCYQRLSTKESGPPYCLHGLNAVYLEQHGWYRLDARGNTSTIDAQFTPPLEQLAYSPNDPSERDLPEIWPEPLPIIIQVLTTYNTVEEVHDNLPDIELASL